MHTVMIRMSARRGKRVELQQAMMSLADEMRRERKGCRLSFAQDLEHEDCFLFLEHWQTFQEMQEALQTELFSVLLGGIHVLCHPPEILVQTIQASGGREVLESIRQKRTKEGESY